MNFHFWFSAVLNLHAVIEVDSVQKKPPLTKLVEEPLGRRTVNCDGEVDSVQKKPPLTKLVEEPLGRRTVNCDGEVDSVQKKPPLTKLVEEPLGRRTVNCSGVNVTFPGDMLLLNEKVLWCPTARCATKSIFRRISDETALPRDKRCYANHPCHYKRFTTIEAANDTVLCSAHTYTWIRNPWDRVAGVYLNKIETGKLDPWTSDPVAGVVHPGGTPTFAEFVRYLSAQKKQNQSAMNKKWMPASERCLVDGDHGHLYKHHVNKLEDSFVDEIADMFIDAGFSGESRFAGEPDELTRELFFYDSKSTAQNADYSLLARKQFYEDGADAQSTASDLVSLVEEIYGTDIESGGYAFDKWG